MTLDLDRLEALAMAAPPGPYKTLSPNPVNGRSRDELEAVRRYADAVEPTAVLALIEQLRQLQQDAAIASRMVGELQKERDEARLAANASAIGFGRALDEAENAQKERDEARDQATRLQGLLFTCTQSLETALADLGDEEEPEMLDLIEECLVASGRAEAVHPMADGGSGPTCCPTDACGKACDFECGGVCDRAIGHDGRCACRTTLRHDPRLPEALNEKVSR